MNALTFDPVEHEYRHGGNVVPSVTQVIDFLSDYSRVPPDVMSRARLLGEAVHIATMLYDRDDLVMDSVHPDVMPYLEAWQTFKADTGFVCELIEEPVYSSRYGYAGMLDRTGRLTTNNRNRRALIDIKTTAQLMPAARPQTAAYKQALIDSGHPDGVALDRFVVLLNPDKTPPYRLEPCGDPSDLATFLAALHLHKWRAHYCK